MSYVPKMMKKFTSEGVEEKNGNTEAVMKNCPSLDLNQPLEEMDLQLNLELNSTDTIKLNPPNASEPLHSRDLIHHRKVEYCCKSCPKKFPNKQALGGHQNAHRFEKAMERRAWEAHEANFGYTGNSSSNGMSSFAFPHSFNQAPKMVSPNYPQSMEHQIISRDYPGSMFPMSQSGVTELSSFRTSPTGPPLMSIQKMIGHGASTSKGESSAITKNDQVKCYRQIKNAEGQQHEDDLDLSLKL